MPQHDQATPHIVIIGCGFGGLEAAKAFQGHAVSVTLIDRTNHHLFQPLLYQVATAGLAAPLISAPIRYLFRQQKNVMTLQTFTEFEKELPSHIICRVHKSFMVNISKIESVEKDRIRIQDKVIPVSETYKEPFYRLIGQ